MLESSEGQIGSRNTREFALTVRDDDGELIAGVTGEFFWNAMYVGVLWVSESARQQGYGRALMQEAESMARTRNCDVSFLFTMTFQAPEFYQNLGYQPIGELLDSPKGYSRVWLAKQLVVSEPQSVAAMAWTIRRATEEDAAPPAWCSVDRSRSAAQRIIMMIQ